MKICSAFVAALALGAALLAPAANAQPEPSPPQEMRGVWVTRFEWPQGGEVATRAAISEIMETLAEHNFNAVFFQIRGQCDVLYPSPYEPWGVQFNWTDPGWDPLQFAIDEARANGLEFHAYINTHTLMQNRPPDNTVPQHPYNLHGPDSDDPWVIHDTDGNPVAYTDSYAWISPGHPDAEAWTRMAIRHVAENYDVDGLHFDRIRTPGPGYSFDPKTVARFEGDGNPDGEEWGDFMRAQITRQLRRIYGATMLHNPDIKLSAAPFGIVKRVEGGYQGTGTESHYAWYQESFNWMESGVLDFLVPQIYWDIGSAHPFEVLLADFLNRDGGRHIVAGMVTSRDYIEQTYETRRQGAPGQVIFSFGSANWTLYSSGPYDAAVPVPDMPWKETRTDALIAGTVTDNHGQPILDARLNIEGDDYNYLTGADGFYAILNIPPGTRLLTAHKDGFRPASLQLDLEEGDIEEVNLVLVEEVVDLHFDRVVYYRDDTGTLTVEDPGVPTEQSTVVVSLTSDSQATPLELTLARTGDDLFSATFDLVSDPSAAGGSALLTDVGETIVAVYESSDDFPLSVAAMVDAYMRVFHEPVGEELVEGFDLDPGWEFGPPQGTSGSAGGPGPAEASRGDNVLGYNLAGGYEAELAEERWLTSPPIDLSDGHDTHLRFDRWLQVGPAEDHGARIEISGDGTHWFTVWSNPETGIGDNAWNQVEYPVGRWMDGRPQVRVRWAMGPNNAQESYAGWHLDGIEVRQLPGRQIDWILDNDEPGFAFDSDIWQTSTFGANYGPNKRYASPGDGESPASWTFFDAPPGRYALAFWVNNSNYAQFARYRIFSDEEATEGELVFGNQSFVATGWQPLGEFAFTGGDIRVTLSDAWEGPGAFVVADALRVTKIEALERPIEADAWFLY